MNFAIPTNIIQIPICVLFGYEHLKPIEFPKNTKVKSFEHKVFVLSSNESIKVFSQFKSLNKDEIPENSEPTLIDDSASYSS